MSTLTVLLTTNTVACEKALVYSWIKERSHARQATSLLTGYEYNFNKKLCSAINHVIYFVKICIEKVSLFQALGQSRQAKEAGEQ